MTRDFIKITGLQIYANHGVLDFEKEKGQSFAINAKLYYDMEQAGRSDQLEHALNYAEVCEFMTAQFKKKSFDLIEAAATELCEQVLLRFEQVLEIELELCKPHAPIGLPFENVSVNMTRGWHRAYLSIGSNMGDKKACLDGAVEALRNDTRIKNLRVAEYLVTEPYGVTEQDEFLNSAISIDTVYSPVELLDKLHEIEKAANRERTLRWGPRTLDLDILFYDDLVMETEELVIPHIDMQNRFFVLKPLCELAPGKVHPVAKKTVKQMLEELK